MSRAPRTGRRLLAGALCVALAAPGHATPLLFSQVPIALATPPAPNVFVTLDDSGSMAAQVNFVAGQEYPVPAGPNGAPIVAMPAAPQTYNNAYAASRTAINLSGSFLTAYDGLPADQKPAYLRWYAFYRTRTLAMRASVMNTFHSQKIPDGKIRLAWQGLTATCASGFSAGGCANSIWPLSDSEGGRTHRTNFYNWVRAVPGAGGTPLPAAYARVGEYLMTTGLDSPYAHLPGTTQLPEVSCRRSYQVMFTDGGWGGASPLGERDNLSRVLPDNTSYVPRGPYAHSWSGTLSDVAFHYWATDLQTGTNFGQDVVPVIRVPGTQTFAGTAVEPYWNPNNNPATWQHLTTIAIAFGEAANITNPQWGGSTTAGTQFAELVAGTREWPTNVVPDLWHAAVNSRGAMYLATNQAAVDAAFAEALGEIASQNVASGGAASSYSVQGAGFRVVRAGFQSSPNLRGTLGGFSLNSAGVLKATPDWEGNTTLAAVAHGSRVVMTASGPTAGAAFRWNGLSTWQSGELGKSAAGQPDSLGRDRVDYLRGDTSKEASTVTPPSPSGPPWVQASVAESLAGATSVALSSASVTGGALYTASQTFGYAARPTRTASPAASTSGNWLAVGGDSNTNNGGGTSATLLLPAGVTAFGFLWGTPDSFNSVTLNTTAGSQTISASEVSGLTLSVDPNVASNVRFEAVPGVSISSVVFNSPSQAFEVANVWYAQSGSGWAGFRWRQGGLLGTIANSEPKVVAVPRSGYTFRSYPSFRSGNTSRTSVAYVGTNDGMLHGFNTASGAPVLSYVPRGVYPFLSAYSDPAHIHRMYVDGPLITADWDSAATSPTPAWRTLLIGGLGAGGRGFFVLDVTNPANFTEANAASIVRFDYTAPPVGHASLSGFITESGSTGMMGEIATDLGHLTADPSRDAYLGRNLQVTRMKNGKWALLLGNGVNSVNERAVLYVFYLDGSGFKKLVTEAATGQGNGLATPLPVDVDNDGLVDYAYAGDLRGRIWKFDLSSTDDEQWKVVQVDNVNTPLIDVGRPITSAPAVAQHPRGGLLVTFGTGRLLTDDDRSSSTTEYLYGVWDKPGGPFQAATSSLVTRTLAADTATTPGGSIAARVLSTTSTAVDYSTKRGWRIALGLSRERVIYNPLVQGTIAYHSTYIPSVAVSSCSVQDAGGSLLTFDVINGGEPASTVVDINGDGAFTSADRIAGKDVMGRGVGVGRFIGLFEAPPGSGTNASCAGDLIMGASGMICARKPPGPGRRAWRDMRP